MDVDDCAICWGPFPPEDKHFRPCPCGFRFCVWCWHSIMTADFSDTLMKPRCPSCRADLAPNPPGYSQDSVQRERRRRPVDAKKVEPGKRALIELLVNDRRLVVVEGLPSGIFESPASVLRHEYFGQYGRVSNMAISDSAVAVRYASAVEAERAVASIHGAFLSFVCEVAEGTYEDDVVQLSARHAPSRWCASFLRSQPCPRRFCVDLHEPRSSNDMADIHDTVASEHRLFQGTLAQTAPAEFHARAQPHFPVPAAARVDRSTIDVFAAEPFELRKRYPKRPPTAAANAAIGNAGGRGGSAGRGRAAAARGGRGGRGGRGSNRKPSNTAST